MMKKFWKWVNSRLQSVEEEERVLPEWMLRPAWNIQANGHSMRNDHIKRVQVTVVDT